MASAAPASPAPVAQAAGVRTSTATGERRAELLLGVVACTVLALVVGMVVFVLLKAWPSFEANGLSWFGAQGSVDAQLQDIFSSPADPDRYEYTIGTWPLIWATVLTTVGAVTFALAFSILAAIFIVEFAPDRLRRIIEPVVRLLAAVPSVVYGLIGLLVFVPAVAGLISTERKESVSYLVQLTGACWAVATVILTVMIVPIMIAIITDALRAVPKPWTEGAAALGVNRWRVMWTISVRTARPAIVAATVLATARALGEAIMLSMVSGSVGFAPNPLDGLTFLLEPARPFAATIVDNAEGLSVKPFGQTIYAFAFVLLIVSLLLSWSGWAAKQAMRKYGVQP